MLRTEGIPEKSIKFSKEELQHYYDLLDESLTAYDCGKLCSPANGGEPLCCSVENAVPMLYREEFVYLSVRSQLWQRWRPKSAADKKQKRDEETPSIIFCECKGVKHCERENRSICCRTFPLEPYIDSDGDFVGLIFMREFRNSCPLMGRLGDIRQRVVDKHYEFWRLMFEKKIDEWELYKSTSRGWRISASRRKVALPLLVPTHLKPQKSVS
jgi:hypothetical protein